MLFRCYAIFLVSITSLSFPSESLTIDLDPIGSNQYLLNSLNSNILESLDYESIIFNQSHHIPYGNFILGDIGSLSTIDTIGVKSQFILRKGDFTFRDLMMSTYKINDQNVHFRYMGLVRSYDPTAIANLNGQNFLQNHMLSVIKKTEKNYLSYNMMYFSENPDVPISYYWDTNDISKSYYNTRESSSILWGVRANHQINNNIYISYQNSSQFSNLSQYINDTGGENSIQNKYLDDIYYSGYQNIYLDYTHSKILLFSSLSFNEDETIMTSYSNNIRTIDFKIGFKLTLDRSSFEIALSAKEMKIESGDQNVRYYPRTPYVSYSYDLNDKSTISYSIGFVDGIYDERIYEDFSTNYDYSRGNMQFAHQELLYNLDLGKHSVKFGAGKIDSISIYNINSITNYPDSYNYFSTKYDYVSNHISLKIDSKRYLKFNDESSRHSTWLDAYFNYSLKLLYPIENKPYTLYLEGKGRLLSIKNGGIFVNEYPLVCNNSEYRCSFSDNKYLYRHFIDIVFGIEFENFILSYHTITNNGDDFSWSAPYSDIGDNFSLPEYNLGDNNYSLFHYLKVSWIFLD